MNGHLPLSTLLKIALENPPGTRRYEGDTLRVHKPPVFTLAPFDMPETQVLDYWTLTADSDDRRRRVAWVARDPVVVDHWEIERIWTREVERIRFDYDARIARLNREIANMSGELAQMRAANGYSNDNSPALGGGKEER